MVNNTRVRAALDLIQVPFSWERSRFHTNYTLQKKGLAVRARRKNVVPRMLNRLGNAEHHKTVVFWRLHGIGTWVKSSAAHELKPIIGLFETTASALDSASGSVLSSETPGAYTQSTRNIFMSKQPQGQASLSRIQSQIQLFRKGPLSPFVAVDTIGNYSE